MTESEPSSPAASPGVTSEPGGEREPRGLAAGLFLISIAVLALQVLQTRILSVQMWHHHSYMVVTMTLLGFAAAGALVTVRPALARGNLQARLGLCGLLFALSTVLGYLLLSHTADRAAEMTSRGRFFELSLFYSYLLLPYFFGGLVVTIALTASRNVHRLYFVNLLGSAVGAWVFIAAITPLGGERLLVVCAATGPLGSLFFLRGDDRGKALVASQGLGRLRAATWAALLACVALFAWAEDWLKIGVASNKAERFLFDDRESAAGAELLGSYWTPLCRLDVVKLPEPDGIATPVNIYQDGDAITVMHSDESWKVVAPASLNTLAYLPHTQTGGRSGRPLRALAIGIGGGIDLRYAVDLGVESILGIEINAKTVDLVRREFAERNDHVYEKPGVTVEVGEGRSTLRRLDERFDVIQLSGTDTYTAGNSGAYVLSESYLYTSEALGEYLDHLTPEGTLGLIRLAYDPPRENLRLFAIGLTALRERGVKRPSEHAVVVYEEVHDREADLTVRFAGCMFSLEPLARDEIDFLWQWNEVPNYRVAYLPGMGSEEVNAFTELAAAIDEGSEEDFYATYPWEVRPVSDDSPFFFNFHPWSALWEDASAIASTEPVGEDEEWYELTGGPIGLEILGTLLVQTSVLVAVLVLLPLLILRRGGLRSPNAWRHLAYFLGLGAGFMFLEISTIQRLVLFLGHPTYSLTVTLCCFLFFAGLGSLYARRFQERPARALRRIVPLLAVGILVLVLILETLLTELLFLPLPLRIAVAVVLLGPLNFLMGMPFPIGLARLQRLEPELVPWAMGANGGASVVGSILCIVIAMESGFRTVSLVAVLLYLGGMWLVTSGGLSPRRSGG